MSTPAAQQPALGKKRGAPKKKVLKSRVNISIDKSVHKIGKKLAWNDGIGFSTWLEKLVRENIAKTEGSEA